MNVNGDQQKNNNFLSIFAWNKGDRFMFSRSKRCAGTGEHLEVLRVEVYER